MLPPADEKPEGAGGTVIINIQPIARGSFFVGDPPQLVDETAARQIAGTDDAVLMLEHQVEEAIAAPVEVEPELEPEPQSGSDIVIVQSASLARRRQR